MVLSVETIHRSKSLYLRAKRRLLSSVPQLVEVLWKSLIKFLKQDKVVKYKENQIISYAYDTTLYYLSYSYS